MRLRGNACRRTAVTGPDFVPELGNGLYRRGQCPEKLLDRLACFAAALDALCIDFQGLSYLLVQIRDVVLGGVLNAFLVQDQLEQAL